jgi:hypothetical protein
MTTNNNPGCLSLISSLFTPKKQTQLIYPYKVQDNFLSPSELAFYKVLESITRDKLVIQCKVRLADIFYVSRPNENKGYSNKINQKHVDFLLCHPSTIKPLLGIELDDSSHNQPKRQKRDAFVDNVFKATNLPLLHVKARQSYNPQELLNQIKNAITTKRQE